MNSSGYLRSLLFVNILIVFLVVPVTADVIFPAKEYGFRISNIEDYPDYYIIAESSRNGYRILSQDTYESEIADPVVYAVKKTDFGASGFSHALRSYQFEVFFSDRPGDDIAGVYETYRIVSINTTGFDLVRTQRIFRYDNGSEISVWVGDPVHHSYNPMASYSPAGTTEQHPLTTMPENSLLPTEVPVSGTSQYTQEKNPPITSPSFVLPLAALFMIAVILIRRNNP